MKMIPRGLAVVLRNAPSKQLQFSSIPNNRDNVILTRLKHKDWLTPKEATKLLNSLTHPSSSLTFFHLYSSRKDFNPTEPFCTLLLSKLAQSKHLLEIHTLLQTLKPRRFSDNFFFTLIKTYAHVFNRIDLALHTLFQMPSFYQCLPSSRTFNFVLNLLVVSKLYDVAHGVYRSAPKLGVGLDACSMNILIKGLCSRGELDAAFRVFDEFPRLGFEPNERTYTTLMKGLCEAGRVEEAFGLLERMERDGVGVDAVVFNVLIGGLRKQGRVEEGKGVLERMVRRGCYPNEGSYNEVLCALVDVKRFCEAKEVVVQMGLEGFLPSFVGYKGLVLGFCEKGLVGDVDWVVRDMVRHGFVPRMGMWKQIVKCVVLDGCVCFDGVLED
ncbi:hypothetical protein RJT34_29358 [Clitoria ternatea]|uniref:Pentatricopeptide repeat-containing protein n=1 Tax=Clitoria ternatea TaxID=43366 RepID=A0AAN9F9X4_CLITE